MTETKLKAVPDPHLEVCPYCEGMGRISASPAVRLRALRNKHKLKQDELAAIIGISRAQIANLEAGRSAFSMELLIRIADQFQVSTDWILGRSAA